MRSGVTPPPNALKVQGHRDCQPLVEVADDGHEDGVHFESTVRAHFRHVLVRQRQAVRHRSGEFRIVALTVPLDHLATATRISGDRRGSHKRRSGHQPRVDERPHQKDEAGRVTAGIRDALRLAKARPLVRRQLGQTENPARSSPMGGARIDDAGLRIGHQRHRFARGRVGKAQEGHIRGIQQTCSLGRILALLLRDAEHLDVVTLREVLVDAQAGCALLAVDKNAVLHGRSPDQVRA